jgi:hypothetical protein
LKLQVGFHSLFCFPEDPVFQSLCLLVNPSLEDGLPCYLWKKHLTVVALSNDVIWWFPNVSQPSVPICSNPVEVKNHVAFIPEVALGAGG